jgi:hypothetical protein
MRFTKKTSYLQVKAALTILLKSTLFSTLQHELLHPMVQSVGHIDVPSLIYCQAHWDAKLPSGNAQAPPLTQKGSVRGIAVDLVLLRSSHEKRAIWG